MGSLTRQTLLKMAVRVALVIVAATVASYLHAVDTATRQALDGLRNYVAARGEREQWIFDLALDNQEAFHKSLVRRIHEYDRIDPGPELKRRFEMFPEGVIRSRLSLFDPQTVAGVAILDPSRLDMALARRVLAAQDTLEQMGHAMHIRFQNTWMAMPENVGSAYWPESPNSSYQYTPSTRLYETPIFKAASPKENPERKSIWTDTYEDPSTKQMMVSLVRPLYDGDQFIGIVGHDITMTELFDRTVNVRLAGTYNLIVRRDGNLITHPTLAPAIAKAGGSFHVEKANDPELAGIYRAATAIEGQSGVVEDEGGNLYLGVMRLRGPDWYLIVVYPKSVLKAEAYSVARFVLIAGVLSLILEVGILFLILRSQVAKPLGELLVATRQVAAGDMNVSLDTGRRDELGELARSFRVMAGAVRDREDERARREAQISKLNEELEEMLKREREKNEALARLRATVDVLSTPVLEVWRDVLVLPLIGAVDDRRAMSMMEKLLHEVARRRCRRVILDVTGVEGMDPATAARLLQVVGAVRLLGARCLVTGISPEVARALVANGVDFGPLVTLRTLKDGLRACIG
jgi:anti-anti-sigma factor